MKHVYKSFTLYPNELFSVQGNDTYYTYQNVGANTATIKGSNDSKTWFTIASVAVGEITQQTHSYAFLKVEGDTEVRGTRGNSGTATSSSNPLPVLSKPEVVSTATGTLGALNAEVMIAVTSEFKTAAMFLISGNLSGTVSMYYSVDSGATYSALMGRRLDANTNQYEFYPNGTSVIGKSYEYAIPIGCTNLKALCTGYASGSSNVKIVLSSTSKIQQMMAVIAIDSGNNRIGFIAASGIQYTDTTAALGSSATFTSSARDLIGNTQGNAFSNAVTYAKTASICVVQDVAFTLQLLGSTDNFAAVSEIYRSIPATLVGSNYVAEVDSHSVAWRYFQYKIVNGASAAARTRGVSKFLAN